MSNCADVHETLTFVVRLWREMNANGHDRWRGRVEHVASQEVGYVEDVVGVGRFIERWTKPAKESLTATFEAPDLHADRGADQAPVA